MRRKLDSILENDSARIVLDYITAHYDRRKGRPPKLSEIANGCNMAQSYASKLIVRLAAEGHLVKNGRNWFGADIPNRAEVEETKRLERARARMMRDVKGADNED